MKIFRSFGIIPICSDWKLLMVCRKDTIGFMEFMKGNYTLDSKKVDLPHVVDLFHMMTKGELMMLMNASYEECYKQLYGRDYLKKGGTSTILQPGSEKTTFETNKNVWLEICKNIYNNGKGGWNEAEWGFPKGKKKKNETELQCALRELREETGIPDAMITIDKKKKFIEKRYEGNKEFIYEYYVGYLSDDFNLIKDNKQHSEISNVGLFTIDECLKKVRHYFKNRIRIVQSLNVLKETSQNENNFLFIH